jgi:excinuclease ABC subunit B
MKRMEELEKLMKEAAKALEFERAAQFRDELNKLKKRELELGL